MPCPGRRAPGCILAQLAGAVLAAAALSDTFGSAAHRGATLVGPGFSTTQAVVVEVLLIDLEDLYWATEGRTSVDIAVGVIAAGGLAVAAVLLWSASRTRANRGPPTPRHTATLAVTPHDDGR